MSLEMTDVQAKDFFAKWLGGEHHIKGEIKPFGRGWCLNINGSIATYDDSTVTRLVLLAHKECVRVEIIPASSSYLKIAIWQRQRTGSIYDRHPSMEDTLKKFNLANANQAAESE